MSAFTSGSSATCTVTSAFANDASLGWPAAGGVELVDGKPWAQHAQELLKSRLTTLLEARVPALRQQLTSVLVSLDIDPTWDPRSIPGG